MSIKAVNSNKRQALENNRGPNRKENGVRSRNRPISPDCWANVLSFLTVTEIASAGAVCSPFRNLRDRVIRLQFTTAEVDNAALTALLHYLCTSTKANNFIRCIASWSELDRRERSRVKQSLLAQIPEEEPDVDNFKKCAKKYNETGLPRLQELLRPLTALNLHEDPVLDEIIDDMLAFMPRLTSLTLQDNSLGCGLRIRKIALRCPLLKRFSLNMDAVANGDALDHISFAQLEKCTINFHFFAKISEPTRQGIEYMLRHLPALREIEITESAVGSKDKIPHPLHDVAIGLLAQRED